MVRTYGRVLSSIWRDPDFHSLSPYEQWLYMSLLARPDLSLCGALFYWPGRWARLSVDITADDIDRIAKSLASKRYLVLDLDTSEALVRSYIRHGGTFGNPKWRTGVLSAIDRIDSEDLRSVASTEFARAIELRSESDPIGNPIPNPITDPIPNPIGDDIGSPIETLRSKEQRAKNKEQKSSSVRTRRQLEPELSPFAAAALEILIEHRVFTSPRPIDNRAAYASTLRKGLSTHFAEMNLAALDGRDPIEIAVECLDLTRAQAQTAAWRIEHRQ